MPVPVSSTGGIMSIFYAVSGYLLAMGVYMNLRIHTLNKSFKESDYESFLDYFEKDYLKRDTQTFRRKYKFVYNSRMYSMANHLIGSMAILIGVIILSLTLWYNYGGV